jgi:ESS family glutamate:Na+ symporter
MAMSINLEPLASLFAALVVLLIGALVNRRVAFLSKYNIPDPITGGLLFAAVASIVWAAAGFKAGIDQTIKPVLLLMFFAGVGMCADLRMLRQGGKALVVFLILLFPYILVQDVVGVAVARLLDLHPIFGLVAGSITLVGGHGTGAAAHRCREGARCSRSEVTNLASAPGAARSPGTRTRRAAPEDPRRPGS